MAIRKQATFTCHILISVRIVFSLLLRCKRFLCFGGLSHTLFLSVLGWTGTQVKRYKKGPPAKRVGHSILKLAAVLQGEGIPQGMGFRINRFCCRDVRPFSFLSGITPCTRCSVSVSAFPMQCECFWHSRDLNRQKESPCIRCRG